MRRTIALSALLVLVATPAASQTARGLGSGDAHSALTIGFEAGLYNPANLSRGGGGFTALGLQGALGMGPVSIAGIRRYGDHLDHAEKTEILDAVRETEGQKVHGNLSAHLLGIGIGKVALNLVSDLAVHGSIPASAAELLLFGNVGEDGETKSFTFEDANARAIAESNISLSYGQEIATPFVGRSAVGVTVRYGMIHGLATAWDQGSYVSSDPISAYGDGFGVVARGGRSYGADLGLSWEYAGWKTGVVVRDLIADRSIDLDKVTVHRVVEAISIDGDSSVSNTAEYGYHEISSPAERLLIDQRLDAFGSQRQVVTSAGRQLGRHSAFGQIAFGSTDRNPNSVAMTLGGSVRPLSLVEFRGSGMMGSSSRALSGGLSLMLGPLALDTGLQRTFGSHNQWSFATQARVSQ